jgi:hypothetical protein
VVADPLSVLSSSASIEAYEIGGGTTGVKDGELVGDLRNRALIGIGRVAPAAGSPRHTGLAPVSPAACMISERADSEVPGDHR